MKLLQKKKLGLVPALSCALTLSHAASASIMINVSDDGTDLTYHITGSIDRSGDIGGGSVAGNDVDIFTGGSITFLSLSNGYLGSGAGSASGNDPYIASTFSRVPSTGIGAGFGFSSLGLFWDTSLGSDPDSVVVDRTFVQPGMTVASAFGTNLDGGSVVLWTHTNSGDAVSIQAVPEPSSSALLIAGMAGLVFRRNRN